MELGNKDKVHLEWSVNLNGFEFKVLRNDEIVPLSEWKKIDFLTKHDQVSIQILNQLFDEDLAKITGFSIILPHDAVANLPEEELNALDLPELFPFDIEIRAFGKLSDPSFRYIYRFMNGRFQPFVNPKRIGAYLEITLEQTYLLTGELYHLIEALDEFNNRPRGQSSIKENLLVFAKIKGLARETAALLDAYLNKEEVIAPPKITLRLKRIDADTIEIEPVFCEEVSDEEKAPVLEPSLDESKSDAFAEVFDRLPKERDIYPVPDGPRIVLEQQQKEALKQVKQCRRISGKKKEILLNNPAQFFDPEVIDLDTPLKEGEKILNWSDRVIEIGEYKPRFFPFIKPAKEPWLPPEEGGIVYSDGTSSYYIPVSPTEAKQLKERVEEAVKVGKKEVRWKGQSIPAREELIQTINSYIEIRPLEETTSEESLKNTQKADRGRNVLIIKDNFEKKDYYARIRERIQKEELISLHFLQPEVQLLPHQKSGLEWLQRIWINGAKGSLVADDMGLGKTLQALSFMAWVQELMDKGKITANPMLVVATVSLLENWKEEYRRFLKPIWGPFIELHGTSLKQLKKSHIAQSLNIKKEIEIKDEEGAEEIILSGRGLLLDTDKIPKKAVVLTTYETMRDYQLSLGLIDWAIIVLDEAQKIKTPQAMVSTAAKAMKYEFGMALTGTPVENSWVDLWSIIDFIQPGYLGSLKEFVTKYQNPLRKETTDREALGQMLKSKVAPLLKRRLKEEHLEGLPKKETRAYEVEMPQKQLDSYLGIVQRARAALPDPLRGQRKQHIFSTIAALRDISLHPDLHFDEHGWVDLSDEEIINKSARLKKTIEILDEICRRQEKGIIFLLSRKMQRVLQRLLKNRYGIHSHIINGEVIGGRRKSLVDAFQETKGFNIIIMSPEAGGLGLNITAANHVIHLSRPWNPAKEDQATDRVYRIGQERPVTVHIPLAVHPMFDNEVCRGAFDLKLHRLLEYKRQLSRSVLLPPVIEENEWQTMGEEILAAEIEQPSLATLSISELDRMSAQVFEKAIATLYRKMGYQVELTPPSRDRGADVIALPHGKGSDAFLIQCKHTCDPERVQNQRGIQEILAADGVYRQEYNTNFIKVVITNAETFTTQAIEIAKANDVSLNCRNELIELFNKHNVSLGEVGFVQ